jgi:hypothetical protein
LVEIRVGLDDLTGRRGARLGQRGKRGGKRGKAEERQVKYPALRDGDRALLRSLLSIRHCAAKAPAPTGLLVVEEGLGGVAKGLVVFFKR